MIAKVAVVLASLLLVIGGFSPYAVAVPCEAPSSAPNTADCSSTTVADGTITIDKEFTDPTVPIDIVFTIAKPPFGGAAFTTISETVLNSTGVPWIDFHMRLGLGTGPALIDFFPGQDPDVEFGKLVRFDASEVGFDASSDKFSTVVLSQHSPRTLDFFDGTVLPGESVTFSLSIVEGNIPVSDGDTFTFRQLPSVPEPASLVLLGVGLAGLAALRRRRN